MEWLKEHIGEELYNKLVEKLKGNDKIKLANLTGGDYVGKDKFSALETAKKDLEAQIKARDTQLEELKKVDAAGLQAKITELQTANTNAKADFEKQLKATQLNYLLETKLASEGAVNVKAVRALLDNSKISLDGENLIGVDEQLKSLKEKETWAFKQSTVPGSGGNPPPPGAETKPALPKGVVTF